MITYERVASLTMRPSVLALVLSLWRIGSADECADFCISELGRDACSKGSYCKNGRYCHALFWTGNINPRICVFTGSGTGCQDDDPVTCSRARELSMASSGAQRSTTTPLITTVTPGSGDRVRAADDEDRRTSSPDQTTLRTSTVVGTSTTTESVTTTTLTQSTAEGSTTTTESTVTVTLGGSGSSGSNTSSASASGPSASSRVQLRRNPLLATRADYGELEVHYSTTDFRDMRPRVSVRFLQSNHQIVYSVLFDTGSTISYMRRSEAVPTMLPGHGGGDLTLSEVRRAVSGEGLSVGGAVPVLRVDEELSFGHEGRVRSLPITERAEEMAELVSPTTEDHFNVRMTVLLAPLEANRSDVGLFGAAPNSALAQSPGFFSFVPSPANRLLIGERDEERLSNTYCNGGRFINCPMLREGVPMENEIASHWVISGFAEVHSELESRIGAPRSIRWIVDTGAGVDGGHFVDWETYESLLAGIRAAGGEPAAYEAGIKPVVRNCHNLNLFPTLLLSVSDGSEPLTIEIPPQDYLMDAPSHPGFCYLNVSPAGVSGFGPDVRLLGMGFLARVTSIFDRELLRVSFCKLFSILDVDN